MTRPASPRLTDVARAAGVSLATASRALSEPEMVRADTRARVREAAAMLGYLPHGAARALATRRTRTVGAVFPPVDNPIFASATHALAQELSAAGYTLLLASHDYDLEAELAATRALVERGADGLVLVGLDRLPETYGVLARAGVPYEVTWSLDGSGHHPCVGLSHRGASIAVTQHLLDLGHREIAVICGAPHANDRARERLSGVRDALAARGLKLPAERVVEAAFSLANGRAALATLLERAPGFTAVIGGNDPLAIGALLECHARGIDVPGALSVTGFDDIELAGQLAPGLTTVRVPSADIGREAGRRLLARLAGETVPLVREMAAPLVVRGTTAAPPRRPWRARHEKRRGEAT